MSGIDHYEKINGLSKAVNDAKGIAKALDALGYKVSLSPDVGRLDFKGKWEAFLRSVNPGDAVVFFYAGHGLEIQGTNYLLPKDTPEVAQGEEILRAWGMNFRTLKQQLDERKPRLTIYIIDACRDNPYKGRRGTGGRTGVAVEKVEGAFILYSAAEDQQALDWLIENEPDPNSVFTRRLIPLLGKRGMRVNDLAAQLMNEVADDALTKHMLQGKHVAHLQRPTYYNGLSGEFCFAGCDSQEAEKTLASQKSQAAEVWGTINQTNSRAVLKRYIDEFKGTFYAELAQARLDEVSVGPPKDVVAAQPPPVSPRGGGQSDRHAFLVGMAAYQHTSPLASTVSDTRAIAAKLNELGYRNQLVADQTRRDFLLEWNKFLEQLTPSSEALIYYNGHGVQVAGENYLIPVDAKLATEASVRDETISLSFLLDSVRDKRTRAALVMLDSCRNNPFVSGTRGFKPVNEGLAPINNQIGSFVMFSSSEGECGMDVLPGQSYGPFTAALLRHIGTPNIDVTQMARLVRNDVIALTNNRQRPTTYDSLVQTFCVAGHC